MGKLLERLGDGNEARVTRAWQGRKVVCIGGGPSLTQEQLALIQRAREADAIRVVAINDQYLVAPWADLLYFADRKWYEWHVAGVEKSWPWAKFSADEVKRAFESFPGEKLTIRKYQTPGMFEAEPKYPISVLRLANLGEARLSEKPEGIHTGQNSGYQVVNTLALGGCSPILLAAYDMRFHDRRTHSHDGHREKTSEGAYSSGYAKLFRTALDQLNAMGVRVVNCTPGSRLTCFPMSTIEKELA
jgi:hypothetical protein